METPNYPFLKLTLDERFPRLLVTRRPDLKTSEQAIYGAFLPTGMLRRKLDFLQKIFRLRPCELDIQGDFDAPCPEYFLHRCLAPCVGQICNRESYLEIVELVHLVLSNQTETALKKIDLKIERLAEELKYEQAAEWLERRAKIQKISQNAKWQIDVSTMNDVITLDVQKELVQIHLTTLRRGKAVGRLYLQTENDQSAEQVVENFIRDFYQFYAPKQIYIPLDFPDRKNLENKLALRFGHRVKIIADETPKLPVSVSKTNSFAPRSFVYRRGQSIGESSALLEEIRNIFQMRKLPRRIECFDVAHLAGKEIIGARVRAVDGVLQREDGLVWEFERLSETVALAAAVHERLRLLPSKKDLPDLILIDGAKPQINAVGEILNELGLKNIRVVGAIKPPKAHNRISHFLTLKNNNRVEFETQSRAMNFLQSLRDAAHQLANETHRELHSLVQIFRNNERAPQVKYLLVPTRYAERGGNAGDLSPIRSLTQAGEIILKTKSKIKI